MIPGNRCDPVKSQLATVSCERLAEPAEVHLNAAPSLPTSGPGQSEGGAVETTK